MELVIALSIIFSIMALFTAIYTAEEFMKLLDRTKRILDLAQRVIDVLKDRTKKED